MPQFGRSARERKRIVCNPQSLRISSSASRLWLQTGRRADDIHALTIGDLEEFLPLFIRSSCLLRK